MCTPHSATPTAGALHVDLSELKVYRWHEGALAVVSTLLSALAFGYGTWLTLPWVGLDLPLIYCLLFGALISPTHPPDCGDGHPEDCRCVEEPGAGHRR
jgi:hypothetical protein